MILCIAFLVDDHDNPHFSVLTATMPVWTGLGTARQDNSLMPFVGSQSGCGFGAIAPEFFLRKTKPSECDQGRRLPDAGGAYRPVLFQFVLCALQFHSDERREFPAHPKIRRGKCVAVLAFPDRNCSFQILTALATHSAIRSSVRSAHSTELRVRGLRVPLSTGNRCG